MKEPSDWHHPRCSGLRVQGTAISPAARNLIIDSYERFVKMRQICFYKKEPLNKKEPPDISRIQFLISA